MATTDFRRKLSAAVVLLVFLSGCGGGSKSPTAPGNNGTAVSLSALTLASADVSGGSSLQGTATLSAAAPAGGTTVTLSSNNNAATVPASITIAAGATAGTFTISTTAVSTQADVTITAAAGGVSRTASLRVAATPAPGPAAPLATLTSRHDDLVGGQNTIGTVTLVSAAPSGGTRVSLASDDRDVRVPASVTIPAGAIEQSFEINTAVVTSARDVRITATFVSSGVSTAAATLTMVLRMLPVANVPVPPVASADAYSTSEDAALNVPVASGVLSNDSDGNADALTAAVVAGPASGALTLNANGSFTYTPNANFNGGDSFTYRANDGGANSNTATVTLTITAVNDTPVAVANSGSTNEDVVLNVAAGSSVLLNDTDVDGDALTAVLVTGPASGALTLNANGTYQYTPNANFNGSDSFTYRANDGSVNSNTVTVSLTIAAVNDAPVAVANAGTTNEDVVLNVGAGSSVLVNDTDVDGDPLTAALVAGPANGALTLNANGTYQYTPSANFNGSDSFTYRASDGTVNSNTVTVSLTVNSVVDEVQFAIVGTDTFTVPAGVTSITIEASGAEGGAGGGGSAGGRGGTTTATINGLVPGAVLQVNVGGQGVTATGLPTAGGFNGGGDAFAGSGPAGTGGGASDVRGGAFGLADRLVVAGGGGGGGGVDLAATGGAGGDGGDLSADPGAPGTGGSGGAFGNGTGGGAGTQASGGAAGVFGNAASGTAGAGGTGSTGIAKGGGGGGGLNGGGGGGRGSDFGSNAGGGGGGGSSFAAVGAANVTHVQGNRTGNGIVIIRY